MTPDAAEALALQALAFLLADPELASRLLAVTGLDPADLAAAARDPQALGGVLDFLMYDDRLVSDFAATAEVAPEAVAAARRCLPGAPMES